MSDSDKPGTGVDPLKVIKPTKRLKAAWKKSSSKLSLKAWAREQSDAGVEVDASYAADWLTRKSATHTAEARKARKQRVRVAQVESRINKPAGSGKKKGKSKG